MSNIIAPFPLSDIDYMLVLGAVTGPEKALKVVSIVFLEYSTDGFATSGRGMRFPGYSRGHTTPNNASTSI